MNSAPQPPLEPIDVRRAARGQIPALARVLARAFDSDPLYEWLVPNDARRGERLEWFFELVLSRFSLELCDTYTTPALEGCAMWKPPGDHKLPLPQQVKAMPAFARSIGWNRIPRGMKLMDHIDAMHARLAPQPHVYLNVLGVDPRQQGQGVGGRLMKPMLARCDADGLDVYLETAKATNVPFYERYGFELLQVAEHAQFPTLWAMLRPAKPRD